MLPVKLVIIISNHCIKIIKSELDEREILKSGKKMNYYKDFYE